MRYTNASYKIPDKEGLITQCMIYCFVKNEYRDDESFILRQLFFFASVICLLKKKN